MAARYDFKAKQGETFDRKVTPKQSGSVINLTGYTARMTIGEFGADEYLFDLTETAGLTLGGTAGTVRILISGADMTVPIVVGQEMPPKRKLWYDLELKAPDGTTINPIEGCFIITGRVRGVS